MATVRLYYCSAKRIEYGPDSDVNKVFMNPNSVLAFIHEYPTARVTVQSEEVDIEDLHEEKQ